MNQFFSILEGATNKLLSELGVADVDVEILAAKRNYVCHTCIVKDGNRCSREIEDVAIIDFIYKGEKRIKGNKYKGCGCLLDWKQRADSNCPLGKWENLK